MRLIPILLALLTLAPLTGCDESTPAGPDRSTLPIMPLAVGNTWIGRTYTLDSLGMATDIRYDTMSIVSTLTIAGETWYLTSEGDTMASRNDGLWLHWASRGGDVQIARHPASVGEEFGRMLVSADGAAPQDSIYRSWVVIAVGTSLKTPSGTYSVTGYETRYVDGTGQQVAEDPVQMFYAPGVGLVGMTFFRQAGPAWQIGEMWDLVEARVK